MFSCPICHHYFRMLCFVFSSDVLCWNEHCFALFGLSPIHSKIKGNNEPQQWTQISVMMSQTTGNTRSILWKMFPLYHIVIEIIAIYYIINVQQTHPTCFYTHNFSSSIPTAVKESGIYVPTFNYHIRYMHMNPQNLWLKCCNSKHVLFFTLVARFLVRNSNKKCKS